MLESENTSPDKPKQGEQAPAEKSSPLDSARDQTFGAPSRDDTGPTRLMAETKQFCNRAQELLPKIDLDHNGFMDAAELRQALSNPEFKDSDAKIVRALHDLRGDIEEYSDDEWGDENDGITMQDLGELRKQLKQQSILTAEADNLKVARDELFELIDDNRDGLLDPNEIQQSAAIFDNEKATSPQARWAYKTIQRRNYRIFEASDDEFGLERSLSLNDVAAYARSIENSEHGILWRNIKASMAEKDNK